MKIFEKLLELITLQDDITHLNETGEQKEKLYVILLRKETYFAKKLLIM